MLDWRFGDKLTAAAVANGDAVFVGVYLRFCDGVFKPFFGAELVTSTVSGLFLFAFCCGCRTRRLEPRRLFARTSTSEESHLIFLKQIQCMWECNINLKSATKMLRVLSNNDLIDKDR